VGGAPSGKQRPAAAGSPAPSCTWERHPRRSDKDSDEDEADDAAPSKPVPDWARGRALAGQLAAQLAVDPDEIFQQRQKTCPLDEVFGARPRPASAGLLRCGLCNRPAAVGIWATPLKELCGGLCSQRVPTRRLPNRAATSALSCDCVSTWSAKLGMMADLDARCCWQASCMDWQGLLCRQDVGHGW